MLRDNDRGSSKYQYSGSSTRGHDRQPQLLRNLIRPQGNQEEKSDNSWSSSNQNNQNNQNNDILTNVLSFVPNVLLEVTRTYQNGFYLNDGSLISIQSQDSQTCTIQRSLGLLIIWRQIYDTSSKVCQITNFQFLQSSQTLYLVIKLRGIVNDDKSFHLNQDTNAKEAFDSGLFSNPGQLSQDQDIYVLASISVNDGKLSTATYIMSKYSSGVISGSKSYTIYISSLRTADGSIFVDGYSNAQPPDTTSQHDLFQISRIRDNKSILLQFNEELSEITGVWQKR